MIETIELEFNVKDAKIILYAETGRIRLRGMNQKVVILNWEGTIHPDYPIEGIIPELGKDTIFYWTRKGEISKDKVSRYDLIIEGEL